MPHEQPERLEAWNCQFCAAVGTLRGPAAADVLSWDHKRQESHARKSPQCHQEHGASGIRVVESGSLPA